MTENEYVAQLKEQTKALYDAIGTIKCPYFDEAVEFGNDGFRHLQYRTLGAERKKQAQVRRYKSFPLAPYVLKRAGTVQQYRRAYGPVGRPKGDGSIVMKIIESWCFTALVPAGKDKKIDLKVVVRKIGTGPLHFYSVMPFKAPDYLSTADPEE